jgi:hypothetical protein
MKKVTPFSNATEAITWMFNNCDQCKRWQCSAKLAIQKGFISGEITEGRANYIGRTPHNDHFVELNEKCDHFINTPVLRKKKKCENNDLILF